VCNDVVVVALIIIIIIIIIKIIIITSDIKPCDATCHYSHYPVICKVKTYQKMCRLTPFLFGGTEPLHAV
jgi:hypothetical protein